MIINTINSKNHHLAECPLWNNTENALYWTDILEKEIWRYDAVQKKTSLVWKGDMQVGGFAFTKNNGLVLCTDKGVFLLSKDKKWCHDATPELLYSIPMSEGERFNDITTDSLGRIFAGTMEPSHKKGKLYLIEKGKGPKVVLENIGISNGMTFSPDKKIFYHTDSTICTITKYDYKETTGEISNPQVFYKGNPEQGFPDGITIDNNGNIWIAFWGASCIRSFNNKAEFLLQIRLPAEQISSLSFGGKDMSELFITSACEGGNNIGTGLNEKGRYLGGAVYSLQSEQSGRKEYLANF